MTLEKLHEMWINDFDINPTNLRSFSMGVPKLFSKYYMLYIRERRELDVMKYSLEELKLKKYTFYSQGSDGKSYPEDWIMPEIGGLVGLKDKTLLDRYMTADKHIIQETLKLNAKLDKVEYLKECLSNIKTVSFHIKNAIEDKKWNEGNE
jgi:hypothetical protein